MNDLHIILREHSWIPIRTLNFLNFVILGQKLFLSVVKHYNFNNNFSNYLICESYFYFQQTLKKMVFHCSFFVEPYLVNHKIIIIPEKERIKSVPLFVRLVFWMPLPFSERQMSFGVFWSFLSKHTILTIAVNINMYLVLNYHHNYRWPEKMM